MNVPIYVCEGTCKAHISQEQYDNGLVRCGAEECTLKGHEFTKMYECQECHKELKEDNPHPNH